MKMKWKEEERSRVGRVYKAGDGLVGLDLTSGWVGFEKWVDGLMNNTP